MTDSLEQRILDLTVAPGTVACVWLGQAGYLFKTPAGAVVILDPYLSDYAEAQWNMPRAIPPAIPCGDRSSMAGAIDFTAGPH